MSNKKFDISKFADKALRKQISAVAASCSGITGSRTALFGPFLNTGIKATKKNIASLAGAIRDARNVSGTKVGVSLYFDEFATLSKRDLKNIRVSSPSRPK